MLLTDLIIEPGVYTCHTPWKNEMDYNWKPGEKIEVIVQDQFCRAVTCKMPGEITFFQLSIDTVREYFKPEE
jgi:hypothetical protein